MFVCGTNRGKIAGRPGEHERMRERTRERQKRVGTLCGRYLLVQGDGTGCLILCHLGPELMIRMLDADRLAEERGVGASRRTPVPLSRLRQEPCSSCQLGISFVENDEQDVVFGRKMPPVTSLSSCPPLPLPCVSRISASKRRLRRTRNSSARFSHCTKICANIGHAARLSSRVRVVQV